MALLVRTPDPRVGESIFGYVLRVAEKNGYDSSWHVLRFAGYSQGEMLKAAFKVDKLAGVVGKSPAALAKLAYRVDGDEPAYQLNGHRLGRGLGTSPFRLRKPAVCPDCLCEDGFARSAWDVSAVVACPRHHRLLVDSCPECAEPLSWFRPGLLKCKCGGELSAAKAVAAPPAVSALMGVLIGTIEGTGLPVAGGASGLPLMELEAVTLDGMLSLIRILHLGDRALPAELAPTAAHTAADALTDWPKGFHAYLRRVGRSASAAKLQRAGLCKQLGRFYEPLRWLLDKDGAVAFVRDEVARFGLTEWGEGTVDKKALRGVDAKARFVSASAFAANIGAMRVTVAKWIDQGKLPGRVIEAGSARRLITDLNLGDGLVRAREDQVQEREAGRILGMPFDVLRQLKRSGYYSTSKIANLRQGYWPVDLEALNDRLVALAPRDRRGSAEEMPANLVSLGRLIGYSKFGVKDAKGRLLAALLDGDLLPVGCAGKKWCDLQLRVADVEAFRARITGRAEAIVLRDTHAAARLEVDPTVVAALVATGHLVRARGSTEFKGVTRQSVEEFAERWIALSREARKLGTSSKGLANRCKRLGLRLLVVPNKYLANASFVAAADRAALMKDWSANGKSAVKGSEVKVEPMEPVAS